MDTVLEQLNREIDKSLRGLTSEQTQLQLVAAKPGKWNIQQIIEHLCLTYTSTEATLSARLVKGSPTRAVPTIQQRFNQIFITTLGLFPGGRKAPSLVIPSSIEKRKSGADLAQIVAEHLVCLNRYCDMAEELFGSQRAVSHMILGPLSAYQWRRFHLIHGRHHIRQIYSIRKANNL